MYILKLDSAEPSTEFQFTKTAKFRYTFLLTTLTTCTAASILLLVVASPINLRFPLQQLSSPDDDQANSSGKSCASRNHHHRHTSSSYHKPPSPYLISRLREYEQHHKRCEPFSEPFNRTFRESVRKKKNLNYSDLDHCRYVIFTRPTNGLGNRMLSLSAAFIYALLTNRVLLVDFGPDMVDLFCEPFHNSTWLLPEDFHFGDQFYGSESRKVDDFGEFLKNNRTDHLNASSFLHLNLGYGYNDYDKLFYKDENQERIKSIPWLILESDQYSVPFLFLMPSFRKELDRLFPDRETVFHHVARYLFNPSNQAWGLITRFHESYLANADQRIGLQIRVMKPETSPTPLVLKQILRCTQMEAKILPEFQQNKTTTKTSRSSKAVLVASLSSEFYTNLKDMFWETPTVDHMVGVHQASHEEKQRSGDGPHNMKAWVDMYLLSMCDVLVTSGWSTFGYVSQGLGGLKPWILQIPDTRYGEGNLWGQACRRAVSMEPCFHFPPAKIRKDSADQFVVECEDVNSGLKLVNVHN
ncbi:Galactoside 2-alpha-L-fucosyltransferase [Linum grandiflorum]